MPEERQIIDYLKPLGKHIALIAAFVLLIPASTFVVMALMMGPVPYEAQTILLLKNDARLTLNDRFTEEILDPARQLKNARPIVTSLDIAEQVRKRAQSSSDPEVVKALSNRDIMSLRSAIAVDIKGDLLIIKASDVNPRVATWLANTWSDESISKLNSVYAPASSADVNEALSQAKAQLDTAEQELQSFLAENPISALTQELKQVTAFLEQTAQSNSDTQIALYNIERQTARDKVKSSYSYLESLEQTESQIKALRTRIGEGPEDPDTLYGNQVTLLTLVNGVMGGGGGLQLQLDFNTADLSSTPRSKANQIQSVDATITALRQLQDDSRSRIKELENLLNAPLPTVNSTDLSTLPEAVQTQLERSNTLTSQIEEQTFRKTQLERTRDLHQSTYDLLRTRLSEQQINQQIGSLMSVATQANIAETLASRSLLRPFLTSVGLSLVVSIVLGISVAFLLTLLFPKFSSNTALKQRLLPRTRNIARSGGKATEAHQ